MRTITKLLIPFRVKNWPSVMGYGLKLKYLKGPENEAEKVMVVKFSGKEIRLHYKSLSFFSVIITVGEIFIDEEYKSLKVKGKTVVDIGAFIGDTAIYFALSGAEHVYSFEAYPNTYDLANRNITENGFKDKVTLINAACGKEGRLTVPDQDVPQAGNKLISSKSGKEIEVWGLDRIVSQFNIKDGILKMDCEGCEYEILANASDKALKSFEQIAIEYHRGSRELIKRLEAASFSITKIINKDAVIGFIFANRK